ncbi:NADH-quinone oxidoreductase subunit C [Paenibacillus tarimensis]
MSEDNRKPKEDGKPQEESPENAAAGGESKPQADPEREAKLKAAAEARAARAAAKAAADAGEAGADKPDADADANKEAKRKAAAEARAARAAAKAKEEAAAEPEEPKAPSPNQQRLDRAVQLVRSELGEEAVEEAYINEQNGDVPTLVIQRGRVREAAELFKRHESIRCDYLRNVSGVDYETYFEVVYHLISLSSKEDYVLKVRTDREAPAVDSVTPVWATANWNEREIYDLLGIDFPGHPDLRRIMMPDDWVGHPLRKDYEPLDPEV